MRPVALALQGDPRLLGLRVKLLDDAVHEHREVERLTVELHEPRPEPRHLEDLIGEPEQPLGTPPDDVGQAPLLLGEGAGSTLVKEVDGAADRRERRPELVGDGCEELPFRLLHLAQLARHRVERERERSDLVAAVDRDGLSERTRGDLGGGRGQQVERASHPPSDDRRPEQGQADGRAQRDQHRGPRARLETRGLGLRGDDPRAGRRHQPVQAFPDLLAQHQRGGVRQPHGTRAVATVEERVLLGDEAPVLLERGSGLAQVQRLPLAQRVLGEALEILRDPRRQLGPRCRIPPVAHHHRARLESQERWNRLAGGRGEAQRGDGTGRDLAVDGHETAHRAEAQGADAREHSDHERGGEEDLGSEPHAQPTAVFHSDIPALSRFTSS